MTLAARSARAVANKCMAAGSGTQLRVYLCPICDSWHLTSKPRFAP